MGVYPMLDPSDMGFAPRRGPDVEVLAFCAESDVPAHIQAKYFGIFTKQHAVTNLDRDALLKLELRRRNTIMMKFMNSRRIDTLTEGYDFSEIDQITAASDSLWAQSKNGGLLDAVSTQRIETKDTSQDSKKSSFLSKLFDLGGENDSKANNMQ